MSRVSITEANQNFSKVARIADGSYVPGRNVAITSSIG